MISKLIKTFYWKIKDIYPSSFHTYINYMLLLHFLYIQAGIYTLQNGIQFHIWHWCHNFLPDMHQRNYHRDKFHFWHNHYLNSIVVGLRLQKI